MLKPVYLKVEVCRCIRGPSIAGIDSNIGDQKPVKKWRKSGLNVFSPSATMLKSDNASEKASYGGFK
jgi:hypothetical protein